MGQPWPRWPQRRSAKRSSFAKRCVCPVLAVARQGAVDAGHNRPICHLETGKKRSELYAKVWAQPMSRLAKELGISDVGLPKACSRHAVPAPPRGYWAKLHAGQTPPRTPCPRPSWTSSCISRRAIRKSGSDKSPWSAGAPKR